LQLAETSIILPRMQTRMSLLERIAGHLGRTGRTEASFGKAVSRDARWVERLREGKVSLASIERAEALLADLPPPPNTRRARRPRTAGASGAVASP